MKRRKFNFLFFEFIMCTIVPFCLPFINEIRDEYMAKSIRISIIFILFTFNVIFALKFYRKKISDEEKEIKNKLKCTSYTNAFELSEKKREYIQRHTYSGDYSIPEHMIPYDVHEYISDICKNFRNTISDITSISKEHMAVTFIYHYIYKNATDDDKSWRWGVGKESTTRTPLNEIVKKRNSLYCYLINGDGKENADSIFCNDKKALEQNGHYYMGVRDKDHDEKGSVFGVRIIFGNYADSLVESILLVSTYGKQFIEKENKQFDEIKLKNLLLEELFPYYRRSIETELGMLYLKHIHDSRSQLQEIADQVV